MTTTTQASHAPGEGSIQHYRRGCRCGECRAGNTAYMRTRRDAERAEVIGGDGQADDDAGILGGAAHGPTWWDQLTAARLAADRAARLGVRETAEEDDGGRACPQCRAPMRWTGGYTVLVCLEHAPPSWERPAVAEQRAAARLEALEAKAGTRIPPREAAEVAEERDVAADRIGGYLEQLARIPRTDRYREHAVRARHHLEKLARIFAAARTYDDLNAADAAEERLTSELGGLLDYAGRIAEAAAAVRLGDGSSKRRGGLLRLLRGDDGAWQHDDDDQDDEDDYPDADDQDDDQDDGRQLAGERPALPASTAYNSADFWAGYDAAAAIAARAAAQADDARATALPRPMTTTPNGYRP